MRHVARGADVAEELADPEHNPYRYQRVPRANHTITVAMHQKGGIIEVDVRRTKVSITIPPRAPLHEPIQIAPQPDAADPTVRELGLLVSLELEREPGQVMVTAINLAHGFGEKVEKVRRFIQVREALELLLLVKQAESALKPAEQLLSSTHVGSIKSTATDWVDKLQTNGAAAGGDALYIHELEPAQALGDMQDLTVDLSSAGLQKVFLGAHGISDGEIKEYENQGFPTGDGKRGTLWVQFRVLRENGRDDELAPEPEPERAPWAWPPRYGHTGGPAAVKVADTFLNHTKQLDKLEMDQVEAEAAIEDLRQQLRKEQQAHAAAVEKSKEEQENAASEAASAQDVAGSAIGDLRQQLRKEQQAHAAAVEKSKEEQEKAAAEAALAQEVAGRAIGDLQRALAAAGEALQKSKEEQEKGAAARTSIELQLRKEQEAHAATKEKVEKSKKSSFFRGASTNSDVQSKESDKVVAKLEQQKQQAEAEATRTQEAWADADHKLKQAELKILELSRANALLKEQAAVVPHTADRYEASRARTLEPEPEPEAESILHESLLHGVDLNIKIDALAPQLELQEAKATHPPEVESWLVSIGLGHHAAAIIGYGYDSFEVLRLATHEEIEEMLDEHVELRKPHRNALLRAWTREFSS